jgi:hypothetical protein
MKARYLPLLALALCMHGAALAAEAPDYVRYAEDEKSARLEIAIKTFALPSGQTVDLVGVVHIADEAYYQELNRRFDVYDAVLFELVGDATRLTGAAPPTAGQKPPPSGGGAISAIQQAAGRYLNLSFQLGSIDYGRKNMVHADITAEQFHELQAARGETTMTLFARAMKAQLDGKLNRAADELDTLGLIRILVSPDSAAAFKKALAKILAEMESATVAMEGPEGTVMLSGRNDVAVKKLKEVLADRKQRRIAVFFGGAHMPGIESSLRKDLDARAAGEEWLAAWTMPARIVAPAPAPGTAKP